MPMLIDTIDDLDARAACARHSNRPDTLIEVLHQVQAEAGHVSDAAIATIADALNLSRAEVLGVVSFYHDFQRQPGGAHTLKLCRAEACQAVGADAVAAAIETQLQARAGNHDHPDIDLRSVYCLGNCALGPAAMLDERPIGRLTPERALAILAGLETHAGGSE
ncbi:NAD(P)H-dependent oxidoreductase subunit E [Maricaulis sp.]|uniref:NAD(P)H-dependent oxidoreductase subunit E n=1 Tax=Maricaulis sp. TaxID=1486257 RepID=UPI002B264DDF|nr:NAD(P)H-dependent oxidoreductase subunit E [Maricaulis sp.]